MNVSTVVIAFDRVLRKVAEVLDRPISKLLGQRVDDFIASQLLLKGGGHPTARAVTKTIARCQDPAPRHVSTYSYDSGLFLVCCEKMLLLVRLSIGRPATPVQLTDPGYR